jgi:hypothetical protein
MTAEKLQQGAKMKRKSIIRRREEIEKTLKAIQAIQISNLPTSKVWQVASKEIHRLTKLLTGKPVKDARGRRS